MYQMYQMYGSLFVQNSSSIGEREREKMAEQAILLDSDDDFDEEELDQMYEDGRVCTYWYTMCSRGTRQCRRSCDVISTNAYYIFMITIGSLLALTVRVVGALSDSAFPILTDETCSSAWCRGNEAVYRVSCGLVTFFAFLLVVEPLHESIRDGYHPLKFALVSILIVVNFAIPNSNYVAFVGAARIFSYFFLLFQGVVVLEVSYHVHSSLLKRSESARGSSRSICSDKYAICYLAIAFLTNSLSIVISAVMLFGDTNTCPRRQVYYRHHHHHNGHPFSLSLSLSVNITTFLNNNNYNNRC